VSSPEKLSTKIIATVVGGLILAAVLYVWRNWLPSIFRELGRAFMAVWSWAFALHLVPGWMLIALGIFSAYGVISVVRKFSHNPKPSEPNWRDFTEFEYEGVLWRWQYSYQGDIQSLTSFCAQPGCDMQMFPKMGPNRGPYRVTTRYECDRCGHAINMDGSEDEIESTVTREIQRLLRSDGWKKYVRPHP
jgi:hypothetical protein